ncbi:16S rRNA (cytidine(1402)-2'-O)-methyltransferase [Xinfangfangia sp. CPCC 101601]|uniref:Ribosomal RNA small subunit methyltransferase I n=1 Tax=Pseudogemmobacter lacusdianii TaxID=3069608 RepID=A0ABU0W018_9RHOB|nr:16S rRNA (cytidine(1402)-2'-O)-methyltransferase [Xinfangfangia sp. CPCC 101601]MDQ2067357.1 16S rRNA (cytidine(1402)-2'-O)-methyltransferase [Xinfangfangia sp. CPCC 101601]
MSRAPMGGGAGGIPPGLHLVAVPIGAARDITLRALDLLAGADVLAAEDTRTLRHLMEIHGVALNGRPLVAYHDHNEAEALPRLMGFLRAGKSVAYAPEAGTPLVSDPGYGLARAAAAEGLPVVAAPGASAVLTALAVSGLPSDRFLFAGFPPSGAGDRTRFIAELAPLRATLILYESPRRLGRLLVELAAGLGPERQAAVCRELTKRFEEVTRGSLSELAEIYAAADPKGEIVLVIDRGAEIQADEATLEDMLRAAMTTLSVKDAAAEVAAKTGSSKRSLYQMALNLTKS